jgi:hypothetical protein
MIRWRVCNVVECLASDRDDMLLSNFERVRGFDTERKALHRPAEHNLGNPHFPDKLKRRRRWKQTSDVSVRPVITPRWPKFVLTAVFLVSAVALAISFSVFYRRGSPAVARSSLRKAAEGGISYSGKEYRGASVRKPQRRQR